MRSRYYPGSVYLHDLALIDGGLYGNAVGHNAVVSLGDGLPRSASGGRDASRLGTDRYSDRIHLQLNSIAAGSSLKRSFFSASTDEVTSRRPGHLNFAVDGRGVIFAGDTREPIARGLTRPHSARLHRRKLWVANSGYGELGIVRGGRLESIARLPVGHGD